MIYVCVEDIKRGGGCPVRTFYGQGRFFVSGLFGAKNFGFFEIYSVSARIRGVEPVRTFSRQRGRGQSFVVLCGRLLWTAPNYYQLKKIAQINKGNVQIA